MASMKCPVSNCKFETEDNDDYTNHIVLEKLKLFFIAVNNKARLQAIEDELKQRNK